ncbi:MAG: heavy metal-associated domain-containing protein [Chitinophagaceae bacterium]
MKKLLLIAVIAVFTVPVNAQFTKATLQATGLTCAMCSNAIDKALQKVPFIETVKADIKNSAFHIAFKKDADIEIDALKEAVEDAGFSIGSLQLTGNFSDTRIEKDQHLKIGKENFHFVSVHDHSLQGEKTITVVDRNFVTAKEFKKQCAATKMDCIQTGKAASCCMKDGMAEGERVYHVTI